MSHSSDKPWYPQGLGFACTGCGDCCTGAPGYVWVTKAEIAALAAAVKLDTEQLQRRYVRLVGIRRSLIEYANGDCAFFDNVRRCCKVYAARPRQCRTWPFWASNLRNRECWDDMAAYCPGANKGRLVPLVEIEKALDGPSV
jgi:uncharacterized protein